MALLYTVAGILLFLVLFIFIKILKMISGRKKADAVLAGLELKKISNPGTVKDLSIIPLIDYYAEEDNLCTEEGVAYLIKADGKTILFDAGLNKKKEHPSPLLKNMEKLGVSMDDIDMMFISHVHNDHIGGFKEERRREFSFSSGFTEIGNISVYAPDEISPSEKNPGPVVHILKEPEKIDEGLISIGIVPKSLFLIGYTIEHSLAVNVEGKGIVLIVGCGHQGVEAIVERAQKIFDEPVHAVVGGLHFPVNGGRVMFGPFNMQNIVGVDRRPFRGITEEDVDSAIGLIKDAEPEIVSISSHDSSDWAVEKFRNEFGDKYRELLVGKELAF